ncbi:MAG: hypothetical protein JWP29_4844 [Rhodoferax sp.]|nr:hypothetical protein [Rhodoferax sp.]
MPELSKDVVALLQYLAPGFLVAWVYFGLTSHEKPSQFERVVQALIFTVVIQALVVCEREALLLAGRVYSLGTWTADSTLYASLVTALISGLLLSAVDNAEVFHRWARHLKISNRSGQPGEWAWTFSLFKTRVELHLKDGSRMYGYPQVWPSEHGKGHFFITEAVRGIDDESQSLDHLVGVLINSSEVVSVEFIKPVEPNP